MSAVSDIARESFLVEQRGVDWRSGLAGALAAIGPLIVGVALDDPVAGFTAAIGGLNTALCVPRADVRSRLWWGLLSAFSSAGSLALADAVAGRTWSLVVVTVAWVGALAFFRAAGPSGALLGFSTAAVFVILAGLPADPTPLDEQLLWFALGAGAGLVLLVVARGGPAPPSTRGVARDTVSSVVNGVAHDRALRAHALRLAVAVGAATLLYGAIGLPHGYWIALTTLAILQPGERATEVRAIQRAVGTLGGAAVIIAITLMTDERWLLLACAAVAAFGLYALDDRGYFWLVALLTPTVLFMLSAVDFQGDDIAVERVANSALGIVIGLAIGEVVWRLSAGGSPVRPPAR